MHGVCPVALPRGLAMWHVVEEQPPAGTAGAQPRGTCLPRWSPRPSPPAPPSLPACTEHHPSNTGPREARPHQQKKETNTEGKGVSVSQPRAWRGVPGPSGVFMPLVTTHTECSGDPMDNSASIRQYVWKGRSKRGNFVERENLVKNEYFLIAEFLCNGHFGES